MGTDRRNRRHQTGLADPVMRSPVVRALCPVGIGSPAATLNADIPSLQSTATGPSSHTAVGITGQRSTFLTRGKTLLAYENTGRITGIGCTFVMNVSVLVIINSTNRQLAVLVTETGVLVTPRSRPVLAGDVNSLTTIQILSEIGYVRIRAVFFPEVYIGLP